MASTRPTSPTLVKKLSLTIVSILFCLAILGLGEIYCRYFLDINLRKTSREFLVLDDADRVVANRPNAAGTSFGIDVFSDENGFRVPPGASNTVNDRAILLLGDSVTFGVGIPEEKTFAGLLRSNLSEMQIYNSGVVGYDIRDYKRVADTFLPGHYEVERVYLVYCLNDFHDESPHVDEPSADDTLVERVKQMVRSALSGINEFLGPRSELYVLITGMIIDPSRRYYEWDLALMNVDEAKFRSVLAPILAIDRTVKMRGGVFTVVINPYEYQIRRGLCPDPETSQKIMGHLKSEGVAVIDTCDRFAGLPSSDAGFLFADPMHLNTTGHKLVFDALISDIKNR
jgi:lysophospholipase L1-like esterase